MTKNGQKKFMFLFIAVWLLVSFKFCLFISIHSSRQSLSVFKYPSHIFSGNSINSNFPDRISRGVISDILQYLRHLTTQKTLCFIGHGFFLIILAPLHFMYVNESTDFTTSTVISGCSEDLNTVLDPECTFPAHLVNEICLFHYRIVL